VSAARTPRPGVVDALLDSLPPVILVVGKGGVGKTTCAAGLTACLSDRGESALLLSTDPAGSLGSVLGTELKPGERSSVPELPGCTVLQLDARNAREAFLARWRSTIVTIMDRGTYLDAEDIEGLVDAAFPGADEIFALLTLAEFFAGSEEAVPWHRIVVDTAPTGHTLRLLALPETFDAVIALLEAMQGKHRFMVSALTHRYRADAADDFLAAMRRSVEKLRSSLSDAEYAAAVLVTRAEDVVVRETRRYARELEQLRVAVAAIVVDAVEAAPNKDARCQLVEVEKLGPPVLTLPRVEPPPVGVDGVRALMARLRDVSNAVSRKRSASYGREPWRRGRAPEQSSSSEGGTRTGVALSLLRSLTIVGGKGGVGKTTVSCALAISAAAANSGGQRVLLVSTDPAPSIGDALGVSTPRWARTTAEQIPDLPLLEIWQMDASTAFEQLRERYQDRIDNLFEAWLGRGIDIAQDRAILRDLLALAPPGIDELYALAALGEVLEHKRYERIIVDPAPTGHLLRLLEMPAIALDWTHRLMRLILKYREIAGLRDAAQELLDFSRRTRALDQLLRDGQRAGIVLVTLEEAVVEAESLRLATALRTAGVAVIAIVENRVSASREVQSATGRVESRIVAPEADAPLVGIHAISDWCRRWQQRN
jgi:arsenite/tail-anchored protein-transporting ATPase